jgi:hypothetical protein
MHLRCFQVGTSAQLHFLQAQKAAADAGVTKQGNIACCFGCGALLALKTLVGTSRRCNHVFLQTPDIFPKVSEARGAAGNAQRSCKSPDATCCSRCSIRAMCGLQFEHAQIILLSCRRTLLVVLSIWHQCMRSKSRRSDCGSAMPACLLNDLNCLTTKEICITVQLPYAPAC